MAPIGEHILSEYVKEARQDHELWKGLSSVVHTSSWVRSIDEILDIEEDELG
jgi:hypothetical protein